MVTKRKRRALQVGDTVLKGRYEILKVIHTSGMANIYLVSDNNLKKQWCLKEIVKSEAGRNNIEYRSLLQEANILKSLNNSGIPRIVTSEEEGDSLFIVMDYVDGISVREYMRRHGAIKQDVAVKWIKQVCNILSYLHNRKHPIFYRDMKPDNIMIQEDMSIKLLDFGISVVITSEDTVIKKGDNLGTQGYAAPEQGVVGNKYDLRSDIYSLGMTMYHMLTGISPSVAKGKLRPIREVNSSLSKGLEVVVGKCIMRNPDDRYQTIEEVIYALNNYDILDTDYRKKAKRKINTTMGLFGMSVLLFTTSFIPLGLYKGQQEDFYKEKLEVAIRTGRTNDYIEAISLKPTKLQPYQGLIESLKEDGVFSKEEEKELLGLINPNLGSIQDEKEYGKLAYNIGKLYWFYYEGSDGDTVSSKWFKESMEANYKKEDSKVYYDLGNFKKEISMSIAESSDVGMYKEYWKDLMSAKNIDSGEIVELQIYNSIADAISTYSYKLAKDGISKEDMLTEVSNINKFLEVSNPTTDKSRQLKDKLSNVAKTLPEKINIVFKQGGVE